ncbi:hypothetical protein EYF80_047442 [Liparis tanakae]|uniref:Uncharacterized protein n=1 Tax=Liparis tanakae TaxID=230148 RepID=A0A4Z2FMB5_9TELE|nr:hypothetical protein EYF80_047442 [Liparis tanakae]
MSKCWPTKVHFTGGDSPGHGERSEARTGDSPGHGESSEARTGDSTGHGKAPSPGQEIHRDTGKLRVPDRRFTGHGESSESRRGEKGP